MLFNSYPFLLGFLPVVWIGFFLAGRQSPRSARVWLVGASILFYGYWIPYYLPLVAACLVFNYAVGLSLSRLPRKRWLVLGLAVNLGILGYYKYFNFFLTNLQALIGIPLPWHEIILPLGVSFFTFQQMAYLVDIYHRRIPEIKFIDYCLFIAFFPQWIAGPIVLFQEIQPQIEDPAIARFNRSNVEAGVSMFAIGLFKKVILADGISAFSTRVFNLALTPAPLHALDAWGGVLAYTFQIYFDFSGYSDMAIGLGNLFNFKLPANFNSPYKATNMVEFWQRWHMTLSRFLKVYLYIPLGGNRRGSVRRFANLMVTMLLGGLWHGAGWNFLIWGGLHGVYLSVTHFWRQLRGGLTSVPKTFLGLCASRAATFLAVVVTWTFFRASDLTSALKILKTMVVGSGLPWVAPASQGPAVISNGALVRIAVLATIVWLLPNSQEWLSLRRTTCENVPLPCRPVWGPFLWRPSAAHAVAVGLLAGFALLALSQPSEFLYFQF